MKLSVIMLVSLALAGCTTDSTKKTAMQSDDGYQGTANATASATWDGTVQSIDRFDVSTGAVGAAAAGAPAYRVTVKRADGSVETIDVESMPSYRVGDSVRFSGGVLSPSPKY